MTPEKLSNLPIEVLQVIARHLDVETAMAWSRVSKKFEIVVNDYRVWDYFTFRDFGMIVNSKPIFLTSLGMQAAAESAKAGYENANAKMIEFSAWVPQLLQFLSLKGIEFIIQADGYPEPGFKALRDWVSLNLPKVKQRALAGTISHYQSINSFLATSSLQDADGWTPLHWLAQSGCIDVLESVLVHDEIDANKVNSCGNTPLHIATRRGCIGAVKAFLNHSDIDVTISNHAGESPLAIAIENGCTGIAALIREHMADQASNLMICKKKLRLA